MRTGIRIGVVALVVLACLLPLPAQKVTSTIRGTVTDPSGAAIAGAEVTVRNQSTNLTRAARTNSSGEYVVTDLEPGKYEVRVKQQSFKESVTQNIELFVSSTAVIDAALQVGSASEQVTVEANPVQVETSTGAVGNVVEGNEVRELPLNGRSFVQLTQLMPGVSPQASFDPKNKGLLAGVDFSVNGNNTTGNIFMVDGVNNNDIGSNRTILVYPSIDAIQEFKILRNSYGPEYGQAMGAIINLEQRVQQMCQRQQRSRETSRNSVSQTTARLARMHLRSVPIHSPVCRPDRLPLPVHCWYSFFLILIFQPRRFSPATASTGPHR
ncbi:MAG: hypothetical protein DMG91_07195 [Acidobacteria bacterium]|nr:MAG: hypothetical protein DMG91_07195 [Acidobacteriota bacterium]